MTTNESNELNIRYSYHRDPENEDRVLCIARAINSDGSVSYGLALNNPPRWSSVTYGKDYRTQSKEAGDVFNKKTARMLATGRLVTEERGGPMRGMVRPSCHRERVMNPLRLILEELHVRRARHGLVGEKLNRIADEALRTFRVREAMNVVREERKLA